MSNRHPAVIAVAVLVLAAFGSCVVIALVPSLIWWLERYYIAGLGGILFAVVLALWGFIFWYYRIPWVVKMLGQGSVSPSTEHDEEEAI